MFVKVPDEEEPKKLEKVVRWRIVYGRARSLEDYLDGLIPYLRQWSSMTNEERDELGIINRMYVSSHDYGVFYQSQDFLNSIHLDYRGLIEKGLALEAPEGMYNN